MVLLLDMKKANGPGKCLQEKVTRVVPPEELEEFETFEDLFQFLHKLRNDTEIIVLRAFSSEELIGFRRIRDLMRDVKIILILPNRKPETLFQGHLLHPRYMTYEDGTFDDLALVLAKMLERRKQRSADYGD